MLHAIAETSEHFACERKILYLDIEYLRAVLVGIMNKAANEDHNSPFNGIRRVRPFQFSPTLYRASPHTLLEVDPTKPISPPNGEWMLSK